MRVQRCLECGCHFSGTKEAPVGAKRGFKTCYKGADANVCPANQGFGPSRKPDSALSRHPSPGGSPGLLWEELRLPARTPRGAGTIWLARTGGLPGRSLTGYRRWALTPPFHPSPVLGDRASEPSAGLLSAALDVTGGLRLPAPRVF